MKIGSLFRSETADPALFRPWLMMLLACALALRLVFCLSRPVDEAAMFRSLPDQREYLELARNLLETGRFSMVDVRLHDEVRAFRTPGYPLFVAALGGHVRAVQVAQCFVDASTVLATFYLAGRWLGYWRGMLASTWVAFNPVLIFLCSTVLTETLFVSMLAWAAALLVRSGVAGQSVRRQRALWWAGAALLALSIHVKPSGIALPLVMAIAATIVGGKAPARQSRFALPVGTSMLLLTCLSLLPWALRNRAVLGEWVWTSTNGGFTWYDGLNPDADGSSNQAFVTRMPVLRAMNEVARSKYLAELAWQYATDHPRRAVELAGLKLARMWSPVPLSAEYGGRRAYQWVSAGHALPVFVLTGLAVWRGMLPRAARVYLLLPAIYLSMIHAATIGSMRYRVPADPMLAVLAASACCRRERPG